MRELNIKLIDMAQAHRVIGGQEATSFFVLEAAELFCSGNSEKLHNTFDAFEHLLLQFVAFGHLGRRPLSARRKQPFKGRADSSVGRR